MKKIIISYLCAAMCLVLFACNFEPKAKKPLSEAEMLPKYGIPLVRISDRQNPNGVWQPMPSAVFEFNELNLDRFYKKYCWFVDSSQHGNALIYIQGAVDKAAAVEFANTHKIFFNERLNSFKN